MWAQSKTLGTMEHSLSISLCLACSLTVLPGCSLPREILLNSCRASPLHLVAQSSYSPTPGAAMSILPSPLHAVLAGLLWGPSDLYGPAVPAGEWLWHAVLGLGAGGRQHEGKAGAGRWVVVLQKAVDEGRRKGGARGGLHAGKAGAGRWVVVEKGEKEEKGRTRWGDSSIHA